MTIAFIHHNKAFLPALTSYSTFFSKYNVQCEIVTKHQLQSVNRQVEWFFMGTDLSRTSKDIFKIHEYRSSSTPPLQTIKDFLKKQINSRPDLRIFKNAYVEERFNFKDQVPFCYQDIGISQEWLTDRMPGTEKEFDFIYVGELSRKRRPEILIEWFATSKLRSRTLLLLSRDFASLEAKYKDYKNIIFKGPVDKKQVKEYIQKSRFGLNFIPDIEPFNELTSTKLLEYAALKTPIITTSYKWVREFEKKYGGRFFYLENDLTNFTWENINGFQYSFPDLTEWTWESQIRKSGVLEFLSSRFPHIRW